MSSSFHKKTPVVARRKSQVEVVMPPLSKKFKKVKSMMLSSSDEEVIAESEDDEIEKFVVEDEEVSAEEEEEEDENRKSIVSDEDNDVQEVASDEDGKDNDEEVEVEINKHRLRKKRHVSSSTESLEIPLLSSTPHHKIISTSPTQSKSVEQDETSDDIVKDIHKIAKAQRKTKEKGKNRMTSSSPAVTYVTHKIKHPGTSKRVTHVEKSSTVAEPSTPSPKKKTKVYHAVDDSEDNMMDNEEVATTPVSRLTKKMDRNQLISPKKSSFKIRRLSKDAMEDMVSSLHLPRDIKDHLCPSLYGSYDNLPLLSRVATQETCLSPIAINKLRVYLGYVHIQKDTEQEQAIVKLVTTPSFGPLVYNPARVNWQDFARHTLTSLASSSTYAPKPYISHFQAPNERVSFIIFGGVHNSSVVEERELGRSRNVVKTVPLSPLCLEWPRAFNFFSHVFDFTYMYVPAWDGSIGFMTRSRKLDDTGSGTSNRFSSNPFLNTSPKSSKITQGVRSVDYRNVQGDKTAQLNNRLRGILGKSVPVYNMTQYYEAGTTTSEIQTPEMFMACMANAPLWEDEISDMSFVDVLAVPVLFDRHQMTDGSFHSDLRFNLVAVCLLAAPFMQAS
ncbi:hypothetical protein BDY19DRAFT_908132 [Irpex rosettiformis]|uniref:Uncharacterized protein n=1 Tax=Irpex rosettiformis TaxID=378272 RepID=A0ACB8TXL6_9APHY|nr:hypothetical protein BDY19DRAFT_908132 [Irpex rosettiformis]